MNNYCDCRHMIDLETLEKAMLNKCIEHYEEMIHPKESFDEFLDSIGYEGDRTRIKKMYDEMDRSVPPLQLLYVEMLDAVRRTEHFYKKTFVKCWIYKDGELTAYDEEIDLKNDISSSRVYFKYAKSSFYWDLDRMKAFVGMFYGSKSGCGYVYDIKLDGDSIILDNEQIRWTA